MRRIRSACCARAASGHAAAAPPSSVMNSRRSHSITSSARASSDRRHVDAERLGGLEVDHQFVLGRRLHRQVGRLLALENAVDIASRAAVLVDKIGPVGDQAAGRDEIARAVDRRDAVAAIIAAIRSRCAFERGPPRTIKPSFGPRRNPATARSILRRPAHRSASIPHRAMALRPEWPRTGRCRRRSWDRAGRLRA